jgi:hypothetical protein
VALVKQIGHIWCAVQSRTRNIAKAVRSVRPFRSTWQGSCVSLKLGLYVRGVRANGALFCATIDIPRATADRYVQRWERSLAQVGENRPVSEFLRRRPKK